MKVTALLITLVAATGAASAQTMTTDCTANYSLTTEINDCQDKAFKDADSRLNEQFAKIAACVRGSEENRKRLILSQRAWIRFRDAECLLREGSPDQGGTLQSSAIDECKTQITFRRIHEFDLYLKCFTKDPSMCPAVDCKSFEDDWHETIHRSDQQVPATHP